MAKKLDINAIKKTESKGFENRAAGMSENGVVTEATVPVTVEANIQDPNPAVTEAVEAKEVKNESSQEPVVTETRSTKKRTSPNPDGRPKKNPSERREKKVMIYLTEELHKELVALAAENSMSLNQFVITAIKSYPKRQGR